MGEHSLSARMQQKIDTAANWAKATNFVPKKGEIIVYSDGGGVGVPKIKVGDGTTKVGSLKFIESDGKLPAGRKISLGTAVSATPTEFDGSKDITIPVESVSASYLSWGGKNIVEAVTPLDAAMSYLHNPNRLQFADPAGITVEYSTDNGSTWTDYETSDSNKINFVSGKQASLILGAKGNVSTDKQLRITINAIKCKCYFYLRQIFINYNSNGTQNSQVKIEKALYNAVTTFINIGTYPIAGWSAWNSIPYQDAFGGRNDTQIEALRFTFSFQDIGQAVNLPFVLNIMMFGDNAWTTPSNMARTGHIYDWDSNQNAIFPAGITATSFNGSASKVANSLTLNGKSFDGSSAVSLSSQQLGVPSAFIAKSVSVLDCNNEKIGRVLSSSAANSLVNGPAEIGSTGAGVLWNIPLSAPTSSINESEAQQKLYQIFVYDSGKVYLRKNSSNDTATWTYGTWEKLLTDVNITADNIQSALGYTPVKDVQVGGTSILTEGVANVPIAGNKVPGVIGVDNYSIGVDANNNLFLFGARKGDVDARSGNIAIDPIHMDYAVKAAMCDGKGAAWTADEQKAARERIGVHGEFELIEEITLSENVMNVAREAFPDGTHYNLRSLIIVVDSGNVENRVAIDGWVRLNAKLSPSEWAYIAPGKLVGVDELISFFVYRVSSDGSVDSYFTSAINATSTAYTSYRAVVPSNIVRFGKHINDFLIYSTGEAIPANTKITIYGVRA